MSLGAIAFTAIIVSGVVALAAIAAGLIHAGKLKRPSLSVPKNANGRGGKPDTSPPGPDTVPMALGGFPSKGEAST